MRFTSLPALTGSLFFLLSISIFPSSLPAQTFYGGANVGLHASCWGNKYTDVHVEFGRRWKDAFGLGAAYLWSRSNDIGIVWPGTDNTEAIINIHAIGLQARLELGRRWLLSFDAGSVVAAAYTFEGVCAGAYRRDLDPYFRSALSYRLGAFTLGVSQLIGERPRFRDSHPDAPLPTSAICDTRALGQDAIIQFAFTLGVNFPQKKR